MSNITTNNQAQESKNKYNELFKVILKIPEKNVQDRIISAINNRNTASISAAAGESTNCDNNNQYDITNLLKIPVKQWINDEDFYELFQNVDKDRIISNKNVNTPDGYNKTIKNAPMNTILSTPLPQKLPTVSDTLNKNNGSGTVSDKLKKITNKDDIDMFVQQNILHTKKEIKQINKVKPPDTTNEGHNSNSTTNSTLKLVTIYIHQWRSM